MENVHNGSCVLEEMAGNEAERTIETIRKSSLVSDRVRQSIMEGLMGRLHTFSSPEVERIIGILTQEVVEQIQDQSKKNPINKIPGN